MENIEQSATERIEESKKKKKEKKKEANRQNYLKNKQTIIAKQRERIALKKRKKIEEEPKAPEECDPIRLKWKLDKRRQRAAKATSDAQRKSKERERKQHERDWKRKRLSQSTSTSSVSANSEHGFQSRVAKKRKVNKVKKVLPRTPSKRAAVVRAIIESPATSKALEEQGVITTPEQREQTVVATALMNDYREALETTKRKRSNDSRAATQASLALLCGKNVKKGKLKNKVAKQLNINRKSVTRAGKLRDKVLKSEKACWTYTERRTRSDAISKEDRKIAHDFWASPNISRISPQKSEAAIRKRIAPKTYVSHARHILEKTQTEAYVEFKEKFPQIKMGQRSFKKCKPFYVTTPKMKDRITCCCRSHVETRMVFKSCMEFRRNLPNRSEAHEVYDHLSDIVNDSLCPKRDADLYHQKDCIMRVCSDCGISKLKFMKEEMDVSEDAPSVKWRKFEYVVLGVSEDGKERKRLQLVEKTTRPGKMFAYLQKLLHTYSSHQFRARWQNQQFQALIDNLPIGHVCAVHDYSENYSCVMQNQLQSLYFSQTQVSIHVTVLHRHALLDKDGEESTETKPVIITEHLFVISKDCKHDHHSVHRARELMDGYLKEIGM